MNLKIFKYIFISIFINMFISNINAQGTWEVFTKDDGLISNKINQIFEDSKGNLWFNPFESALKGIIKFDGKDWINYYNKHSLVLITTFFEDSKGTVWLGTQLQGSIFANGLWKINGDSFERISKVGSKFIAEGSDGKIWFGAKKLCSYDGNSVIEYSKKELGGKKIAALYRDNLGSIWVGTESGVSIYEGKNWKIFSNISNCPTKSVNSIISDANGNIWFGAENGVFKYDGNNWQHFTVKDGLVGDATLFIRIDSHNNIYAIAGKPEKENFGLAYAIKMDLANKGLSIFENGRWRAFSDGEGVPANLRSIYIEDKSGNLWFNSKDKTIYKFDGMTWTSFNENNGFRMNYFGTMLEDSKGNYWFAGNGIGKFDGKNWSYFNKDSGLPSNIISSIIEDKDGNIWFGTFRGVVKYTPE